MLPNGKRTSALTTLTPASVIASAISRVPIEPNNLPSSPALEAIVISANSVNLVARACAAVSCPASLLSKSVRRASKCSTFALEAKKSYERNQI
jgi:hypothetical protein